MNKFLLVCFFLLTCVLISMVLTKRKIDQGFCTERYVCPVVCRIEEQLDQYEFLVGSCENVEVPRAILRTHRLESYIGNRELVYFNRDNQICACPTSERVSIYEKPATTFLTRNVPMKYPLLFVSEIILVLFIGTVINFNL